MLRIVKHYFVSNVQVFYIKFNDELPDDLQMIEQVIKNYFEE